MKNILVVEDEKIVRSNICELLEEEGYKVETVNNGAEALQKLNLFLPDLVITDIVMPILDGYELIKKIQENPVTSTIPVILLSAKVEIEARREGMKIGADDYLTKPFKSQDLLEAVATRLNKREIYNKRYEDLKKHVATYIPHELRTPLVSILGFADLLISNIDDLTRSEIMDMAEKVRNSGIRLYERIEKFLYYTDLELRKSYPFENNIMEVEEEYIRDQITARFKDKVNGRLEIRIRKARIAISEEYLIRILYELVDNCLKFCEHECKILIKGYYTNQKYVFEVSDNGIGMNNYEISQIEAFKQFNRDELQQHGTGLGLAIVKNILQIVNGDFSIESRLTEYTKITFKIDFAG